MAEWRYIAQRATTGEFLEWDVPLSRDELRWDLSGPGALRGTVPPDLAQAQAADGRALLEDWGTLIYAEAAGEIRWGGIIISSAFDGARWAIEAAGFTTYAAGVPYLDVYDQASVDPLDAVREIWRHIQAQPDGNLGLVPDNTTTPVRLGTSDEHYRLVAWEAPDCGEELDNLAKETPFDYTEAHSWAADGSTTIEHRLQLSYPRLGRRRSDLAFIEGDNMVAAAQAERDGGRFANEVVGLGRGEGEGSVQTRTPSRDGRLRRPYVYTDRSATRDRLVAASRRELTARRDVFAVSEIEVADHPNAPLGSWSVGDDILVQATVPWLGDIAVWHRVTSWALTGGATATLSLARSDSFNYGNA